MDQPDDERHRRNAALRATGVGLGLLGATFGGVAGWFTLAPAEPLPVVAMTTPTGTQGIPADGSTLRLGSGRAHTRTGGL